MLPGYGRPRSARDPWSSRDSGKDQSQLPPTRASVLRQVAQHKGPGAACSSHRAASRPRVRFVPHNKQIHAAPLPAVRDGASSPHWHHADLLRSVGAVPELGWCL